MRRFPDWLATFVCAALACLYLTGEVLDADEAIFATGALRMHAFELPVYGAIWDLKPPGVFLAHAWTFAPFSRGSLLGPHLATAAIWICTALVLGRAARRLWGDDAFAPTVIAYALLRSYGAAKAGAANTEAFLQLPLVVAGWLLLAPSSRPRWAAIGGGALLAVAALFKAPVAAFGLAAVAAVAIVRDRRAAWTTAWGGAVGALGVAALTTGVILWSGDGEGFWACNVVANREYVAHVPETALTPPLEGLWREMSRRGAAWVLVLCGLAAAGFAPRRIGDATSTRRQLGAGLVLLLTGLWLVTLGSNYFRHYWWMVYPLVALFCGAGWVAVWRTRASARATWIGRGLLLVAVVPLLFVEQRQDKRWLLRDLRSKPYRGAAVQRISAEVRVHSGPDDPVFVWGINPAIYLYSERLPATRFVTCGFLSGFIRYDVRNGLHPPVPDCVPGSWDRLMEDLHRYPPRCIVDTTPSGRSGWEKFPLSAFPRLAEHVAEHYRLAGSFEGYDLYVRREP